MLIGSKEYRSMLARDLLALRRQVKSQGTKYYFEWLKEGSRNKRLVRILAGTMAKQVDEAIVNEILREV